VSIRQTQFLLLLYVTELGSPSLRDLRVERVNTSQLGEDRQSHRNGEHNSCYEQTDSYRLPGVAVHRSAGSSPTPVPITNRVLLIMPMSASVKGTSFMMSSSEFVLQIFQNEIWQQAQAQCSDAEPLAPGCWRKQVSAEGSSACVRSHQYSETYFTW